MSAPFGIELYSAIDDLDVEEDLGQARYLVAPPRPHPQFMAYLVQATQNTGVVWVKGISRGIENDAYGFGVRSLHEEVESQLARRYGHGETTDRLCQGSIWDEDRDWVSSITQSERSYFTLWRKPSVRLPDDLESVFLGVSGVSNDEARVVIEYDSPRSKIADEEVQRMLSDLL